MEPITTIALLLATAKVFGYAAKRFRQPPMIGELAAGVLLGPTVLNFVRPEPYLEVLAELGIFFLVFFIGMRVDLETFVKTGRTAWYVGFAGAVIPFFIGYLFGMAMEFGVVASIILGICLSITGVGVVSEVLSEFNLTDSFIGRTVLEAGLLNDIFGLISISFIVGILYTTEAYALAPLTGFLILTSKIIGFFLLIFLVGHYLIPFFFKRHNLLDDRNSGLSFLIIFILIFTGASRLVGFSGIIGAFVAGALLKHTLKKSEIGRHICSEVGVLTRELLVPLLYIWLGLMLSPAIFFKMPVQTLLLIVLAILGKLVGCGLVVLGLKKGWKNALAVGIGMNDRGALELVVAELGRRTIFMGNDLFSLIILMAFVTTAMTPILFGAVLHRHPRAKYFKY